MHTLRILTALLALALPIFAKVPITHEAMWMMKRVGAPVPSPDGKWVVFSLVEPAYDEKDQVTDLWIVATDGSDKPRRLTATKGVESGVAWSPDSRRVAFTARREGDEVNQIYLLDVVGGGEAVRFTTLSTAASSPRWRPDGKALLFSAAVYPGAANDDANKKIAAERKARKYSARVYESFPIRYWDKWLDDTQTHLFVQPLESGAKARDLLAGTKLVAEPGFAGASTLTGEELGAVWAPDGQSIVFAATTKKTIAAYAAVVTQLWQVAAGDDPERTLRVAGGAEPKALTNGENSYSRPAFSPDGRALFALYSPENNKTYNLDRLARFSWPFSTAHTLVTGGFDRSVGAFALAPDSRTVYLLAEEAGHEKLFSVPAAGGEVRPPFPVSSGAYTNLAIPGKAASLLLVANWESAVNPAELVRIDPATGRHVRLTDFNAERAAEIDWQPVRHFWFTAKNGKKIHSLIALPSGFDESKKYPLLVLLHGGPHGMWRDQFFLRWNYHLLATPPSGGGYVVLLTNYTGSTGFGEKFAQEIQGDPFVGPAGEINEAADEAIRRFAFVDGSRQAAGGASYGGHLANWLQATTTRYKALISHAGLINLESQWGTSDVIYHREVNSGGPVWEQGRVWKEQNPIRFAKNFRTPILLTVGERDYRVPLNQTIENWSVLQRLRIPSRLIVFPEANHWIQRGEDSRFFYQEVHAWLKKFVSPT